MSALRAVLSTRRTASAGSRRISHSHTRITVHPAALSNSSLRQSRLRFVLIFCRKLSAFGPLNSAGEWLAQPYQKQPSTNTATFHRGSTKSGVHWATTRRVETTMKSQRMHCAPQFHLGFGVLRGPSPEMAPFSVRTHSAGLDDLRMDGRRHGHATPGLEPSTGSAHRFSATFDATCSVWSHPLAQGTASITAVRLSLVTAWALSGCMMVSFRSGAATLGVEWSRVRLGSCVVDIGATEQRSAALV